MLGLLAAGVVLFALLLASYSRRNTWIALGSTIFSIAALLGAFFFLAAAQDSGQVHSELVRLAKELPPGWNQYALDLATAIERASTALSCETSPRPGCPAIASAPPPVRREPIQAAAATGWFDAKPDRKAASPYPIAWLLDEPATQVASTDSGGFLLSGTNVSDQPLEKVRAVLKPDSGARDVELVLAVEGLSSSGGALIPPGAQFSLMAGSLDEAGATEPGGAILSFSYVQAGQRRTSIKYLTPPMLARLANRG